MTRRFRLFSALVLALVPVSAWAQAQPQVGIVTTLKGQVTVSRSANTTALPLKFKDSIFERDRINTAEKSSVRVLMGGKAIVTVRELSVLTITEDLGKTTINLDSGKIAVAVAKKRMNPGDRLEVQTPNAVAAVRGTVFVVEVKRQGAQVGGGNLGANTQVTTVSGTVETWSTANPANAALVHAFQSIGITAGNLGKIGNLSRQEMDSLLADFASDPQFGVDEDAWTGLTLQEQNKLAALAAFLLPKANNQPQQQNNTPGGCGGAPCVQNGNPTPATPPPTPTLNGKGVNVVVNPGFETGIFPPGWSLSGAGAVIKNIGPITAPSGQFMGIIHTGTGAVGATTSGISQSGLGAAGSLFNVQVTYNLLSNEWPTQPLFYNDTFVAKVTDRGGVTTEVARAERDTAPFHATPTTISGGGFTLSQGNGIAGWTTSSKMVSTTSGGLDKIAFEIFDIGDTAFDSAVLLDSVVVALDPPLHFLQGGATLTRTGLDPLIDFRGGTETFDSAMVIGAGSRASLAGPLLRAAGTDLNVDFSLLSVLPGGSFVSSTTDPLVSLQGGTHVLGSTIGIFDLAGSRTALDAETGLTLATDKPLSTGGTLFQADGATVNTQQAVRVDMALLEATAPLIAPDARQHRHLGRRRDHPDGPQQDDGLGQSRGAGRQPAQRVERRARQRRGRELPACRGRSREPAERKRPQHLQRRAALRQRRVHRQHLGRARGVRRDRRQHPVGVEQPLRGRLRADQRHPRGVLGRGHGRQRLHRRRRHQEPEPRHDQARLAQHRPDLGQRRHQQGHDRAEVAKPLSPPVASLVRVADRHGHHVAVVRVERDVRAGHADLILRSGASWARASRPPPAARRRAAAAPARRCGSARCPRA